MVIYTKNDIFLDKTPVPKVGVIGRRACNHRPAYRPTAMGLPHRADYPLDCAAHSTGSVSRTHGNRRIV